MSMGNGQQGQIQVMPPPFGEPLNMGLNQMRGPEGKLIVFVHFMGPGRSFSCLLSGEDAEKWGKQLEHIGRMTKAGLVADPQQFPG
jgi:hypothetical protein